MRERNIGLLLYYKPGAGLTLLREQVLGEERFDKALREYVKRWAYKHPTPEDFFRTIENVTGEELSWFWRGWFMNKWKIDQGVKSAKYKDGDFSKGVNITVANIGQLPMPTTVQINFKDGSKQEVKLPVEVWKRNTEWTFHVPSKKEITSVKLDPTGAYPDADLSNNTFTFGTEDTTSQSRINVNEFVGTFTNEEVGMEIEIKVENNHLVAQAANQPAFPITHAGGSVFKFEEADVTFEFADDLQSFILKQGEFELEFNKK